MKESVPQTNKKRRAVLNHPTGQHQKRITSAGLLGRIEHLLEGKAVDAKTDVGAFREILEVIIHHLCTLSGIQIRQMYSRIEKLASIGVIDHEVLPYFHFWWSTACLGSHFQPVTEPPISWNRHLEVLREVVLVCIDWYAKKYPPLQLTIEERTIWLQDADSVFAEDRDSVIVFNEDELVNTLDNNGILILHGRPWIGKTSIGGKLASFYCDKGFIPLVMHENSLVTFRALHREDVEGQPANFRLSSNAQTLHELITTRLLHGDSFLVFLDDPFGHRRFQLVNALMHLRVSDWLDLSNQPHSLGTVLIIITTPSQFLEEARELLKREAAHNPIARRNLALLDEANGIEVRASSYSLKQLSLIIKHIAVKQGCLWSANQELIELIAEVLLEAKLGFDSVHALCRSVKGLSDDDVLDREVELVEVAAARDELADTSKALQLRFCAGYVGEALIEFYREFGFQTSLAFDDICAATQSNLEIAHDEHHLLRDWLVEDRVATQKLSNFPVFVHPEVRASVSLLAERELKADVRELVLNLSGLNDDYSGSMLMKWEAVHLVCRMAAFFNEEDSQKINNELFFASLTSGFDPRNTLWAVINNQEYIRGTSLERYANGFLKAVPDTHRNYVRLEIRELVNNWVHLDEEVRLLVLDRTTSKDKIGHRHAIFDDQNTLAFLSAAVANYSVLQAFAESGSTASEEYLDFIQVFINQLAKKKAECFYASRAGDGLFESPGSRYTGEEVLVRLADLGRSQGSFDEGHPMFKQLRQLAGIGVEQPMQRN